MKYAKPEVTSTYTATVAIKNSQPKVGTVLDGQKSPDGQLLHITAPAYEADE